jgi:hypothetical protein
MKHIILGFPLFVTSSIISADLMSHEKLIQDPNNLANDLINFSITITEKLNIQQIEKIDVITILIESFPGNFPRIKMDPITEAEMKSVIQCLKQKKKSSGYDEITSKILKTWATLSPLKPLL